MVVDRQNISAARSRGPILEMSTVLGISATLLLFLSMLFLPMMGLILGFLAPMPTVIAVYRRGFPAGYLVPGIAGLAVLLLVSVLNLLPTAPYLLSPLLIGAVLGEGMRRGWSLEKTIGSGSLLMFLLGLSAFWAAYSGSDAGLIAGIEKDLSETITAVFREYAQLAQDSDAVEPALQSLVPLLARIMPGVALSSSMLLCWVNLVGALRYCRASGVEEPAWSDWDLWKSPDYLVWGVITAGFLLLAPLGPVAKAIALNALIVLGTVYFFQGLSVAAFYLEKWKLPRIFRAVIYGFLFVQQLAMIAVVLVGLSDVWADYRRDRTPSEDS